MDEARVRNLSRGTVLAERAGLAVGVIDRMVGLLGRSALPEGEGLWIEPCNSVHMWFMRFPIDVVFASAEGTVVDVVPDLCPWAVTWPRAGARVALELPAGTAARTGTVRGDRIAKESACA